MLIFAFTYIPFIAIFTMIASSELGVFHSIGYDVMMAKLSENRFRATIYSGMMAIWNAMFIIGPVIGGVLYSGNPRLTFFVTSILLLITFIPIKKISIYFHNVVQTKKIVGCQ
ncbi:MFS family permease [Caldanaerobacter subterraneus subsp. tengcongensis MB4]|uniref:Major facilitator superfamily (MFS) profile domain-containing protein n=1 Tax=Caldanaerobacter subterraneus subsp. tengcongensis (strain DSM 15242 / JCM 11007 / NBRC 100824 / MB4) TaxID=273068 RepID=Q8R7Z6_CALS4|nr:hypothetical protein [Caldanaerobacter subterraneus]AAM25393.1 hypothetical protein TTE2244 [Caldanaerobacter subterraneus subsp. tengcongensis MB4]MCS3915000.1 MFS family permease [Caldanaerobacter subterraneus subsp. tengcongensis MB4]